MEAREWSAASVSHVPVVVVGAGPVGCVLALELAGHGVPSTVLERSTGPSRHPKMDFINGRSMELLRRLGLSRAIRERAVGPYHPFDFIWTRGLDETPILTWEYSSVRALQRRMDAVNDGSMPLEPYARLQGSLLEDVLRRRVREHPLVDVREGCAFEGLVQNPSDVLVQARGMADDQEVLVRADYVVGCDGAGSTVRESVGIDAVDAETPTQHCDVYFRSSDPVLRKHGRAFLTIFGAGLTLVSRDEQETWTGTFPILDERTAAADPVSVIKDRIGVDLHIDEVLSTTVWEGRLSVASDYRHGSVFLAGDAAHQFYPTGGHGANTGIGDAVDLGWKLAARSHGWGGPALLASYEQERRPVAEFNREMCANLLEVWRRFPELTRQGVSTAHLAGFLRMDSYQIDNMGIHFGYRYDASPIVWHEDGPEPEWHWREIVPTTWPGGRPPSLRLSDSSELFDHLGTEFTLVDLSDDHRGKRVVDEAKSRGIPMNYLSVHDPVVSACWERKVVLVRPDQHVAWRADAVPEDCAGVLNGVCGHTG